MEKVYNKLIEGIKQYFKKSKIKKAVIGLSGGIDSALALRLTADAIGNKNVTALMMPEKGLSKRGDVKDAVELCESLKVGYKVIEINKVLKDFEKMDIKQNVVSLINLKPRIRMLILYNYANANNALVIGTSNKTELTLGYFTKHGDGACDIEVIGGLYKAEVYGLSRYLGLPLEIINKVPSAGLFKGQSDEKEIGERYVDIDKMLEGKIEMSDKIKRLIQRNRHKSERIPIIKVY